MFRQLVAIILLFSVFPAQATEAGWALLRNGGQVVLMRHAIAPGSGDPANFDIENCGTQRNLSERGRLQARRIGALVDARAAPVEKVLASRYCRTRDTATQAFGPTWSSSFPRSICPQTTAPWKQQKGGGSRTNQRLHRLGKPVLITHLEIIEALIGASAREGEAIILSRGGDNLHAAARIKFN